MANNLESVVDKYLEFKSQFWAQTTIKSEKARLNTIKKQLFKAGSFEPSVIFRNLKEAGYKPYAITTLMIRLADLEAFAFEYGFMPEGEVPQCKDFARRYLRSHNRGAYSRSAPKVSFEEAKARINEISCEEIRCFANTLLETGIRFFEVAKIEKDEGGTGVVVKGKGGIDRPVFNLKGEVPQRAPSHWYFWKKLKKETGLKPHDLRKIAANRFAKSGLAVHELMTVMGWRRLETAQSYLKVTDAAALNNRLKNL
jgi:integrase